MSMISRILFFGFFLTAFVSFGQNIDVSGVVTDNVSNEPLPGASVVIKDTSTGVTTDFDGKFYLSDVPINSVLVVSSLGYKSEEIVVLNGNPINVGLIEDTDTLDEVVIIGYGTQKVSKISGSISTVGKKSISTLQPVRAEDALQGQASGVTVISSGSPGAKPTVLIRGIPSYTGTDPLVVIDGVSQTLDDLNALNPNYIESMSVLKDAALTAIYGISGGNGVIVIKTKGGRKNQKATYSFDSSYAIQEVTNTIDVLNASKYAAILNEASVASGGDLIFPDISGIGVGTNWQDEVIKDAPIIAHNFTVGGGSETTTYFLSAGYLSQEGVVFGGDKSYFDRLNLTSNISIDLSDNLKAIINTSYANIKNSGLSENNIGSVLSNALNFDPMVSPYDANGNFGISNTITQEIKNPLAQISNSYNKGNTNKLFGKMELQYDILDNLKVTSRFGYTYTDVYGKNFSPLQYYGVGHNSTNANEDLSPIITTDDEGVQTSTHNRVSESRRS